jgi:hypothetical protein
MCMLLTREAQLIFAVAAAAQYMYGGQYPVRY